MESIGLRRAIRFASTFVVVAALLGARVTATAAQDGEPLRVIATFTVLADVVKNVGGDDVEVVTLVGQNADAHTFEPKPDDVAKLSDAALVFENGLEFERWLDDLYEASDSKATRVVVTSTLTPREMGDEDHADEEEHAAEDEHADEDGHEHGEHDPHVWHDVTNVIAEVAVIRDALVTADPDNAATYQANADAYIAQLTELDAWVQTEVAKIPEGGRKLVTSHDTFGYFAERYGFTVIGTALGSLSTESGDPAAADIAALVTEIEAAGVPAIFAENVSNPDLMESIAAEAGVTLAPELYTDALGPTDSDGSTYIGMMRHNVTIIVNALTAA